MTTTIIILTVFACFGLAGIVFFGIFVKEKSKEKDTSYYDEELNGHFNDFDDENFI